MCSFEHCNRKGSEVFFVCADIIVEQCVMQKNILLNLAEL